MTVCTMRLLALFRDDRFASLEKSFVLFAGKQPGVGMKLMTGLRENGRPIFHEVKNFDIISGVFDSSKGMYERREDTKPVEAFHKISLDESQWGTFLKHRGDHPTELAIETSESGVFDMLMPAPDRQTLQEFHACIREQLE